MTKLKAELLFATPLWLLEHAARESHDSIEKFNGNFPSKNAEFIKKTGHDALLKHGDLHYKLTMPRTILVEFEKHVIGVCSPMDVMADINKSTRYTLKNLLKLIEEFLKHCDNYYCQEWDDLLQFVINNVRDPEMAHHYASNLAKKYESGCTTPDTIKEALPESWMVTGDYKISYLAMKNIIKQRYEESTGKPHFLIKELIGLMIDCLDRNRQLILNVGEK